MVNSSQQCQQRQRRGLHGCAEGKTHRGSVCDREVVARNGHTAAFVTLEIDHVGERPDAGVER
ncbi:hypothetical protein CEE69_06340 [Rhodopirellula bahusiensis]|uniref:Uncharacterized protein n=1 Tax=Rhodopirellula bahusiensis TaxID=2014065 RepID=A0A2G1WB49_9BACT|nr:hypothetical protein CEE69_06340 [Rhodopirellula bahusiensis]